MKNSIIRIALLFGLIMSGFCAMSQVEPTKGGAPVTPNPNNHRALISEPLPEYPGGEEQMMLDLYKDLEYPAEYAEANIEGKVIVDFVVEIDGTVSNIQVKKGIEGGEKLSEIAMNAVKRLKPFKPSTMNGKPIRQRVAVVIVFMVPDSESKKD